MSSRIARSWLCDDPAGGIAIGDAVDRGQVAALGDLLDGEVELVARDEVDRRALAQALLRLHRDLGADEADLQRRVGVLQRLRHLHVGGEGRRRGVDDAQLVVARLRQSPRPGRCRAGGASISLLPAPARPAGPARSGYQKLRISRRAW